MRISLAVVAFLVTLANACFKEDGTSATCGPGADRCSKLDATNRPRFHVVDKTCNINDPNGPVYDQVHGVYHLFYQDHLAMPPGHGPDYGHAVSRDLAHWAHLHVAIWNDKKYDNEAIYTGSATVVDGKIVQLYPGLCNKNDWPSCPTGTNLAVAVPADPSDPLYKVWTKPAYNPIRNGTQRDPSTAWKTSSGEWRLTTFDTVIYGSMDFKEWYVIGPQPGFAHGECPSFFPLPRTTPGSGPAPLGAGTPTHVHKASHGGDWMNVGTYVANGPKKNGEWTATPGVTFKETHIDKGKFYASKDFYDPVKKRRINWGWAQVPPASAMTLPREITWNPELQQLVHSPVEEQDKLRGDALASIKTTQVKANQPMSLGDFPAHVGNQSEVEVSFAIPSKAGTFGVAVMANDGKLNSGMYFYVQYIPPPNKTSVYSLQVGAEALPAGAKVYQKEMPNYNLRGNDYNVTNVDYTDFKVCEAQCAKDSKCTSYTYVIRGPKHAACCLKTGYPDASVASHMTSGVKNPADPHWPKGPAGTTDTLLMSPNDTTITIRVYNDITFSEGFWQNGRVAMTIVKQATTASLMAVGSDTDITLNYAEAYRVNSIWVSPEEVLRTPRLDGKPI